ncbi:MAG: S9 family peptidase [Proteobacteria bacterium]|nr:S9 family peptidase [Pseudomonadota bacterium]
MKPPPTQKPDSSFLYQYARTFGFQLGVPTAIRPTPDGDAVIYLRSSKDSLSRDLYSIDTKTGVEQLLLRADDLVASEGPLPKEEKARRERQRLLAAGIARYRISRDGSHLLAPLAGRLFLIERATGAVRELRSQNGWPIDPQLSPDAGYVASVRDGDLYVSSVANGEEKRLTRRDNENIQNGVAEFVAQEEMARSRGYWWSPDSTRIAYQRTDNSGVETLYIADPARPERPADEWHYPRVGTQNADVRLGVVSIAGGETTWVDWDRTTYPYLARVTWEKNSPLTILVQNRSQTVERLLAVDPDTGRTRQLLEERDPAWLNIDPAMPHWLPDGRHFLWTTERNGSWQLELRRADGSLSRPLTAVEFPLRKFLHVDVERDAVYVTGNAPGDPTQSHLYKVPFSAPGMPEMLTREPGYHLAKFARRGGVYVHEYFGLDNTITGAIYRVDGKKVADLPSRAVEPPFVSNSEITSVEVDGRTYWAVLIRPRGFDGARSYPVLVNVYGGPHSQTVTATGRRYLLNQWIADHGFIVVSLDGRGTPSRGREWERAIKGDLGTIPLDDQVAGLKALAAKYPALDLKRVGIWGWSFGGYMSAMAILRRPDVYHAAVAGAPVADWRDYDTHYTERYMGLLPENTEGYDRANVLTYADQLERPLMIIHGTADDNVYFTHSLKLSEALLRAGKAHDFVPLSGHTHRVAEPAIRIRMMERIMAYFTEHLR